MRRARQLRNTEIATVDQLRERIEKLVAERGPARILIIDDDEQCFQLFEMYMIGCVVMWAIDYKTAMDTLLKEKGQFDAIVVDENLRGMPGHEIIKNIRQLWPRPMTVLCTAYVTNQILEQLGLTMYLPKPLLPENLITLINLIDSWRV
jgi:CheY-like chemotaxis protein